MKGLSIFFVCLAAIPSAIAFSNAPAMAQKKTIKACQEEWRANKEANQAAKITEKAYVAKCRGDSAKPAAATTAPATAAPTAARPKPATSTPTRPATKQTASGSIGANQFTSESQAKSRCPSDTIVFVNLNSKIYHFAGHKDYGNLKNGAYMCEKDTAAIGARAAKNEKHP